MLDYSKASPGHVDFKCRCIVHCRVHNKGPDIVVLDPLRIIYVSLNFSTIYTLFLHFVILYYGNANEYQMGAGYTPSDHYEKIVGRD